MQSIFGILKIYDFHDAQKFSTSSGTSTSSHQLETGGKFLTF